MLDIEGTTTPADFVYRGLFPYASSRMDSFLQEHFQDSEIQAVLSDLRAQHQADERHGLRPPGWPEEPEESRWRSAAAYGRWLIERDSKCTALKSLQGKIWQYGYARGDLKGEVYPDVPTAFARWRGQQKKICIYSSGSELAQRLLFRTVPGDLTQHIAGFFDTRVGPKTDPDSYKKIAVALGDRPEEILFISDAVKEIQAAEAAGMHAVLCMRGADSIAEPTRHRVIRSFDEIFPA